MNAYRISIFSVIFAVFCLFPLQANAVVFSKANSKVEKYKESFLSVPDALKVCQDLNLSPAQKQATKPHLIIGKTSVNGTPDTIDTILSPIKDGKPLYVPLNEFPQQPYLKCGIFDITAAPFYADKTGNIDATQAIQQAINSASLYNLVVYLPVGNYKVTDTLECIQPLYQRSNGVTAGGMRGGCYFFGQQTLDQRPKLILPPNTPGFTNKDNPKNIVKIWARGSPNAYKPLNSSQSQSSINMNNLFVGIDIDVGSGNFGATAILDPAAQGSVIEDVNISLGDGYRGIYGLPASGGSTTNVSIDGGEFGIEAIPDQPGQDVSSSRGPSVTGLTLTNQRTSAIVFGVIDAFTITGTKILMASGAHGPAIDVPYGLAQPNSNISLIDSVVEFPTLAPENIAIRSRAAVYIKNSYFKNSPVIFKTDLKMKAEPKLMGSEIADLWLPVHEFAYAASIKGKAANNIEYVQTQSILIDGVKSDAPFADLGEASKTPPPVGLMAKHLWGPSFSKFTDPRVVNVKSAPYNAQGDGTSDDTQALQQAINNNEVVFLPKGYYKISNTLTLKPETKILGLGVISSIIGDPFSINFSNAENKKPLMETSDQAFANTQLSFFQLFVSSRSQGMYAFHWQSGGLSIMRNVDSRRRSDVGFGSQGSLGRNELQGPLALINHHGGGKIYNFHSEFVSRFEPQYRHILVDGISGPLAFYQLNVEGGEGEAMVEIRNSAQVSIYQIKIEGEYVPVWIKDSKDINLYSNSGNGYPIGFNTPYPQGYAQYKPSYYRIENSKDVRMVNLTTTLRIGCDDTEPKVVGCGALPDEWYMVYEKSSAGKEMVTPILERPILYKTAWDKPVGKIKYLK